MIKPPFCDNFAGKHVWNNGREKRKAWKSLTRLFSPFQFFALNFMKKSPNGIFRFTRCTANSTTGRIGGFVFFMRNTRNDVNKCDLVISIKMPRHSLQSVGLYHFHAIHDRTNRPPRYTISKRVQKQVFLIQNTNIWRVECRKTRRCIFECATFIHGNQLYFIFG